MPSRAQIKAAQSVKLPGSTATTPATSAPVPAAKPAPGGQPPVPSRAQVKAAQQVRMLHDLHSNFRSFGSQCVNVQCWTKRQRITVRVSRLRCTRLGRETGPARLVVIRLMCRIRSPSSGAYGIAEPILPLMDWGAISRMQASHAGLQVSSPLV